MLIHSCAQWQHYYTYSGITRPNLPQGLQLVNIILASSPGHPPDTLHTHYLLPFGIFVECKGSVSSPCLASISKGSMRLKRLDTVWLQFAILIDQVLAPCITTLVNNPNSQVILKYSQVYLNSQPSTVTTNLEGSRPLVSMSTAVITG